MLQSNCLKEPPPFEEPQISFDFCRHLFSMHRLDEVVNRKSETKTCYSSTERAWRRSDSRTRLLEWSTPRRCSGTFITAAPFSRTHFVLALICCCISIGECYIRRGHSSRMDLYVPTAPPSSVPQFDPTHSGDVTALAEHTAILNCRVHNNRNKTVSWIRHRDIHLLTVGKYTYTSDQRFRALHEDDSDDWLLKINYVQTRDSGVYECQVSTTPPMSHFVRLNVVKPETHILGGPDIHINKGSTINLTCVVQFAPKPPKYINWHHGNKIISYDSERGGVTVIIEKGDITTSSLLIQDATDTDSGRYDCHPSNSSPGNITVHVLNGEHPEAMQHGGQSAYDSFTVKNIVSLLLVAIFL